MLEAAEEQVIIMVEVALALVLAVQGVAQLQIPTVFQGQFQTQQLIQVEAEEQMESLIPMGKEALE